MNSYRLKNTNHEHLMTKMYDQMYFSRLCYLQQFVFARVGKGWKLFFILVQRIAAILNVVTHTTQNGTEVVIFSTIA